MRASGQTDAAGLCVIAAVGDDGEVVDRDRGPIVGVGGDRVPARTADDEVPGPSNREFLRRRVAPGRIDRGRRDLAIETRVDVTAPRSIRGVLRVQTLAALERVARGRGRGA